MKAVKITCDRTRSPLVGANFADSFALDIPRPCAALKAAELSLGYTPSWVRQLMALRNLIVAPLGLKHDSKQFAQKARFIGAFPVISETPERVVMGFDDKHLDFRVTIDVTATDAGSRVIASTWVKTHNRFGQIYLACVMPFHRLIVPAALNQLIRA